jgi:hypothetical protein
MGHGLVPYLGETQESSAPSLCRKPRLFNGFAQTKAVVSIGRDLIASLLIRSNAAYIRHEDAGFSGNVGANLPRTRQRVERTVRNFVVMLHPGRLGIRLRFDAREAESVQILQTGDPIDVLLARQDHLAFDAGTLRAGNVRFSQSRNP